MTQPTLRAEMAGARNVSSTRPRRSAGAGLSLLLAATRQWCVVVYVAGELDLSTAAELDLRLTGAVEPPAAMPIVLNFQDVSFIDAACVRVVLTAWTAARCQGRDLRVDGLHGRPARVFGLLGLDWLSGGEPDGH